MNTQEATQTGGFDQNTLEECKQLQVIAKIRDEVCVLDSRITRLENALSTNLARVASTIWRKKIKRGVEYPNAVDQSTVDQAIAKLKRSSYDAGCLSLELERKLFSLDAVIGVREARRAQVKVIKKAMERSDSLMNKTKTWKFYWVAAAAKTATVPPALEACKAQESQQSHEKMDIDLSEDEVEDHTEEDQEEDPEDQEDETEQDQEQEEQEHTTHAEKDTAEEESGEEDVSEEEEESEEESAEWEKWKRNLPRIRKKFQEQRTQDGLALYADVSGVERSSLTIKTNKTTRSISVAGVSPYQGWFEETFVLPTDYSMKVSTHQKGTYLVLNITRKSPKTVPSQASFYQTMYRQPHAYTTYGNVGSATFRARRSPFDAIFGF